MEQKTRIVGMRTDDLKAPLGISPAHPVFSWKTESDEPRFLQAAYRIEVKTANQTVWDSGKVESPASTGIVCPLVFEPRTAYTWTVTVWDKTNLVFEKTADGVRYSYDSKIAAVGEAAFETGLCDFGGAKWIACAEQEKKTALPVFRREFEVGKGLAQARLYTSGLGVYESWLNGARVGRTEDGVTVYDELKPGFTQTQKRKFYNTYDITPLLREGKNALAAVVSPGWWSDGANAHAGKTDAYLAKLVLTYEDGAEVVIDTDEGWKSERASRILYADIFTGETVDARIDESWLLPGFDDGAWACAKISEEFRGVIIPWQGSPIRTRKDLERPVSAMTVWSGADGADEERFGTIRVLDKPAAFPVSVKPGEVLLVDFGQNFAGREAFTVSGARGATLSVRHGEMLNDTDGLKSRGNDGPGGSVYNQNYRGAKATTTYILAGGGEESYVPLFTFYGFRYVEITADEPITVHALAGQVVTSVERETGFFETSDASVNKLISNIRWGQYSNYLSVPTDCPQRDERQGWTADTQVFTRAGCFLADSKSFLTKFAGDICDTQREDGALPGTAPTGCYNGGGWGGTGWADAGVVIPYTLWRMYGDAGVIRSNWDMMQKYVDGYLGKQGLRGPCNIYGDWLAYESNDGEIQDMLAVAFAAWDGKMMMEMARQIGRFEDSRRYRGLYEREKAYFIEKYVNEDGSLKRPEQSVCAYALYLDLLPDENSYETVKKMLVSNIESKGSRLQTGFLGTAILPDTLTKIGRADLAYTLLLQHENPSWLYSVDQGATTIWERWNSYTIKDGFGDVGMNSFNHYAYGSVLGWMFEGMAGIKPSLPLSFRRFRLAPHPDERLFFTASYDSAYGVIEASSSYEYDGEGGKTWVYACTVPANTTASVILPAQGAEAVTVCGKAACELTQEADGIAYVEPAEDDKKAAGCAYFEAMPGRYVFRVKQA